MNIFKRTTPSAPLAGILAVKAEALRTEAADKASQSLALAHQSAVLADISRQADDQAAAVEEASDILEAAGVTV